jgi:hypothetical protein
LALLGVEYFDTLWGVDKEWFKKTVAESPYGSVRQLARHMRYPDGSVFNHSQVWRMLNGERDICLYEARQLADLLGVPMSEVIRRSGVPFGKRDNY